MPPAVNKPLLAKEALEKREAGNQVTAIGIYLGVTRPGQVLYLRRAPLPTQMTLPRSADNR